MFSWATGLAWSEATLQGLLQWTAVASGSQQAILLQCITDIQGNGRAVRGAAKRLIVATALLIITAKVQVFVVGVILVAG